MTIQHDRELVAPERLFGEDDQLRATDHVGNVDDPDLMCPSPFMGKWREAPEGLVKSGRSLFHERAACRY
jgi:hypothetical protein